MWNSWVLVRTCALSLACLAGALACSDDNGGGAGTGGGGGMAAPMAGVGGGGAGGVGTTGGAGVSGGVGGMTGGVGGMTGGVGGMTGGVGGTTGGVGGAIGDGDGDDDGGDGDGDGDIDAGVEEDDDDPVTEDVDGDGDPNWPPPPESEALQAFPAGLATAICAALEACLGPTLLEITLDGADCVARTTAEIIDGDYTYLQASIDEGRIELGPDSIAACLADTAALGCDVLASRPPASCKAVLEGQVAADGACVLDDDCVSGLFCDRGAGCPGVCKPLLAAGGACDRGDSCQDGLQCFDGACGLTAQHNESCGGPSAPDCHLGLFCIGASSSQEGTCKSKQDLLTVAENGVCDALGGAWCMEGLACVVEITGSGASTAFRTVCKGRVASGAACNTSILPQQCPAGEYCPADLEPEHQAECAPRPGNGQACGAFSLCAPDHYCDAQRRCRPIRRLQGASCTLHGECLSGACAVDDDGVGKHCIADARCRLASDPDPECGDGTCSGGETCATCPADCDACQPPRCGDNLCNGAETCESCAADCGACPMPPRCGDGACNGTETCSTCAADCGACPTPYSGPCAGPSDCAASQVCDQATVPGPFGLPPNSHFGVCTTTCSSGSDCPGPAAQRACGSDGRCYLRCDNFDFFNPNRWCPFGMECIDNACMWRR